MNIDNKYVEDYQASVRECSEYLIKKQSLPKDVRKREKSALRNIRIHLDQMGMKMPSPLYRYDEKDKSTWKFIDSKVIDGEYFGEVMNPGFKYEKEYQKGVEKNRRIYGC